MNITLASFTDAPSCPKCKSKSCSVTYFCGTMGWPALEWSEHMNVTCNVCRYRYNMETADAHSRSHFENEASVPPPETTSADK